MKKIIYLLFVTLLFIQCKEGNLDWAGMWNGESPYTDTRFENSMEYNSTHGYRTIIVPNEDYRIYVCSDTHVDSTNRHLTKFVQLYRADDNCPIALHLGDFINANHNYPKFVEAYANETKETFFCLGNHDLYYNQWEEFKKYFGTADYWFDTHTMDGKKLDCFICFDSANGTLQVKERKWLKNLLKEKSKEGYRHIIVFTHTNMFMVYSAHGAGANAGYPIEEVYELADMFASNGVEMYWCGHEHARESMHFNGVEYITVGTLQDSVEPVYYMVAEMGEHLSYHFEKL